jgi:hypothetical protein
MSFNEAFRLYLRIQWSGYQYLRPEVHRIGNNECVVRLTAVDDYWLWSLQDWHNYIGGTDSDQREYYGL